MSSADSLFSVAGKTALVSGGASGIGAMIVPALLERGVRVYFTARDGARAKDLAAQWAAQTLGTCIGLAAELGQPDAPERLAAELAAREERLDILVNNAGTHGTGDLAGMTPEGWDEMMAVNLRAPAFLTRALLPLLRAAATAQDPARVINIGSIGGLHVPKAEAHPYGASKAGLHHLTRSLAKALGRDHIIVNGIAPGPFPSNMHDTLSAATQQAIAAHIPLLRAGTADDIAGVVLFLASRASGYVNGHVIPLDGGYIAAL